MDLSTATSNDGPIDEVFFFATNQTTVQVALKRQMLVTKLCMLYFFYFPFDYQSCEFLIRSDQPNAIVDLDAYSKLKVKKEFMTKFNIKLTDLRKDTMRSMKRGHPAEEYRFVGFRMDFQRNSIPYIFSYYIPVAAMVLSASMSFWIPPDAIPGRVGLLITLALTLINYYNGIQVSI